MDATSYLLGKKAGGGSGTSNYNDLSNKPSINNVELSGNKTTSDLGIVIPTVPTNVSAFTNDAGYTTNTGTITSVKMNGSTVSSSGEADLGTVITDISSKQDALVSGTNIKTINNESILGSGNITISGGGSGVEAKVYSADFTTLTDTLVTASAGVQTIMTNALEDYNNENTVFLEDLRSGTAVRTYILTKYSNDIMTFSQTAPEYWFNNNNNKGYTEAGLYTYVIQYWISNHKIRRVNNTPTGGTDFSFINPLVSYTNAYTPESNSNPATKKYVDDKPTTYSGYDATKTQVLKNVNGTLQWITEE